MLLSINYITKPFDFLENRFGCVKYISLRASWETEQLPMVTLRTYLSFSRLCFFPHSLSCLGFDLLFQVLLVSTSFCHVIFKLLLLKSCLVNLIIYYIVQVLYIIYLIVDNFCMYVVVLQKMGRARIALKYNSNQRSRKTTFMQRRKVLIKKNF